MKNWPSCCANFVNGADVGMIKRGGRAGFALKALESRSIRTELRRKKLQGDAAAERRILGLENDTHAAAAQLFQNAVVRNGLPDHWAEMLSAEVQQVNEGREVEGRSGPTRQPLPPFTPLLHYFICPGTTLTSIRLPILAIPWSLAGHAAPNACTPHEVKRHGFPLEPWPRGLEYASESKHSRETQDLATK